MTPSADCPEEDFCHPAKVPNVLKDQDCDANCPVRCGPEKKACPGGIGDGWGTALGCPKPETCMPIMDSGVQFNRHFGRS